MKTQCPNCKARFNVDDKFAGKQAKCPKCIKPFTIAPFTEAPVEPPVAAAAPVKNADPAPVEIPIKRPEPTAPPVKSPEMVSPPAKSPEPVIPPVKKPEPIAPPAKIAEPAKEEKPQPKALSKRLSKVVFVYCWMAVRIVAGALGFWGLMLALRKEAHSTLIMTFAAADVFFIGSVIIEFMLFYRMWAAIQDGQASIKPAAAVGFLFIPVFNLYWALNMVTGFAEDYNSYKLRYSMKAKDLSFMLFLIYAFMFIFSLVFLTTPMICVFAFVGLISRAFIAYHLLSWVLFFVALGAGVGHFFAYILFAIKTCNAVNALRGHAGKM
jgi:predicted Zn finger-like uncharacterized protein